uniref:Uncharacterized protein n=1 Tax=Desulfovibrio sp. U5L TaxID=596152 RepID=I2Q2P2_9BACT
MPDPKPDTATDTAQQPDPLTRIEEMLAALLQSAIPKNTAATLEEFAELSPSAKAPLLRRLAPRMLACLLLAVALAAGVALLSPQQVTVALYKLALVTMAGYLGYWLDRWCFPYARPDSFLVAADWRAEPKQASDQANHPVAQGCEQIYAAAMLRRGLIMLGTMLALGLGL